MDGISRSVRHNYVYQADKPSTLNKANWMDLT